MRSTAELDAVAVHRGSTAELDAVAVHRGSTAELDAVAVHRGCTAKVRRRKYWHAGRDSNPRPSGSKPDALSS